MDTISKIGSMISSCTQTAGGSSTTVDESSTATATTVNQSSTATTETVGGSSTSNTTCTPKKRTLSEATEGDAPNANVSPDIMVSEKSSDIYCILLDI